MATRDYSKVHENRVSKKIGGRVVSNSGATPFYKGDVTNELVLVECKTMTKPKEQQIIKREWLKEIETEAIGMRREFGIVAIDFGQEDDYIVMNMKDFTKLMEVYEKVNHDE